LTAKIGDYVKDYAKGCCVSLLQVMRHVMDWALVEQGRNPKTTHNQHKEQLTERTPWAIHVCFITSQN
jgi:hypothetical protein